MSDIIQGMPRSIPLSVWVQAARPKTLTAAVIPVIAGSVLAYRDTGQHLPWITLCALASALCIQIGTNFVNDAIDYKKGADSEDRLGPPRVTQQGLIAPTKLLTFATLIFLAAVAFGLPLVLHGGLPILSIGILSILFGYAYTSGPYPLAYNGLGELFVVIFFGFVAIGGMYLLQTGSYNFHAALLGIQLGLLATLIICINNLRDIEGDSKTEKRTLAVIFGYRFAQLEVAFTALAPFALCIFWLPLSRTAAFAPLILLPLAIQIIRNVQRTTPGKIFNTYLAQAAKLHTLFGLLLSGCLLWF